MKMRKNIFTFFNSLILISGLSLSAIANDDTAFLQKIQNDLTAVSGLKDRQIIIQITDNRKRVVDATPSSITLSYGFIKQLNSIDQLIATMAHMTAHITLDYVDTPPLPQDVLESRKKDSTGTKLKDAIRPKYPDRSSVPQATGSFGSDPQKTGQGIIERPRYHNKDYDYAVNKGDIIAAEHEIDVDKTTGKILKHAGYCPADYSRMLHYFYENPQHLLGNPHFALNADQWQRISSVDQTINPEIPCTQEQNTKTQKHNVEFETLKITILQALKSAKKK